MRVVLDANVLIAAFGWSGRCRVLLEKCVGVHMIAGSDPLLAEVERGLQMSAPVPASQVSRDIRFLRTQWTWFEPASMEHGVCRDPDDLHVLGLAVAAGADCIVTGDRDLLVLSPFRHIPILSPNDFLARLQEPDQAE